MIVIKEAFYTWMKNLAFFYLLFTVFLHLVPDHAYEKYIRFFMGLLLILMFCAPVFTLFRQENSFFDSFEQIYFGEKMTLEESALKDVGESYLKKSYIEEWKRRILKTLQDIQLNPVKLEVQMTDDKLSVFFICPKEAQDREEEILNELERKCGIASETAEIKIVFYEPEELEHSVSDRTSSAGAVFSNDQ